MRKYECVLQDGPKDCGVCSLLTIVKTHGGEVSKEYLRNLTNTNSGGVTALSLLETGKRLGFYTEGVKGDILKLREKLLMFITNKLDYILIKDSLNHILSLPHIYFKNRTTGEVLSRISDLDELKEIISDFIVTIFDYLIKTAKGE